LPQACAVRPSADARVGAGIRSSTTKDARRQTERRDWNTYCVNIGILEIEPALRRRDLLAPSVAAALDSWDANVSPNDVLVGEIDPDLADTRAFCERYGVALERSANCVILAARREGRAWFAACVVLATTRADVNGVAKRDLGASKISFAAMDAAIGASGMEYGGITPLGLPAGWPILIDEKVAAADGVIVGSGLRRSKIWLPGTALAQLPNATVLASLGRIS
jgi:prolyl-tRNA editing enzyme YbaK/EbsC (Cys-tRNA(Pro) deacylase)